MTADEADILSGSHPCSVAGFDCFGCRWWVQELGGWKRRGQLFGTFAMVAVVAAMVAVAAWMIIDEAARRFCDFGRRGRPCSRCTLHDACVVRRLVCATAACVQDVWRLYPHVRGEAHTYICSSGSGVTVVKSAVDREAANALVRVKC